VSPCSGAPQKMSMAKPSKEGGEEEEEKEEEEKEEFT
jgi:hypothetical protein